MNPLLDRLHPYPFERLKELTRDVKPSAAHTPISLGIGEPKHPTPEFIKKALTDSLGGLSAYPATAGIAALREACAAWVQLRYGVSLDAVTQVLPVNGTREALFALAQSVIDPTRSTSDSPPIVVCPNPFYQIYEGAALLAGARTAFVNSDPARNYAPTGRRSTTRPGRRLNCSMSARPAIRPARYCRNPNGRDSSN